MLRTEGECPPWSTGPPGEEAGASCCAALAGPPGEPLRGKHDPWPFCPGEPSWQASCVGRRRQEGPPCSAPPLAGLVHPVSGGTTPAGSGGPPSPACCCLAVMASAGRDCGTPGVHVRAAERLRLPARAWFPLGPHVFADRWCVRPACQVLSSAPPAVPALPPVSLTQQRTRRPCLPVWLSPVPFGSIGLPALSGRRLHLAEGHPAVCRDHRGFTHPPQWALRPL